MIFMFHLILPKQNILNGDYYFEGISTVLKKFIDSCPKCQANKNLKLINVPEKVILNNDPHDEIQMDILGLFKVK